MYFLLYVEFENQNKYTNTTKRETDTDTEIASGYKEKKVG